MKGYKNKKIALLTKKSGYITSILLAFMSIGYLYVISNSSVNCSIYPDDSKILFNQFIQNYLEADTFSDKFKFLFSISNHPHPKISARLFCILNYAFFDQVNLRAAQIISSLFTLGLFFTIARLIKNNLLLLLIASLLFIPLSNNFWPISAISLPFLFLIALVAIKTFIDERYLLSSVATFFTIFSSGQGFLVFVILFAYSLLNRKKHYSSKRFYVWLGTSLLAFIYLFSLIKTSSLAIQNSQQFFVFDVLPQRVSYLLKFFTSGYIRLWEIYFSKSSPNSLFIFSILAQLYSLFAMLHVLYHTIKVRMKFNRNESIAICYFAFFVSIGLLAAFVKTPSDFDTIYPRYHIWSFYFLTAYLMFLWATGYITTKINALIIVVTLIISSIYVGRLNRTFTLFKKPQTNKCIRLENTLMRKTKNVSNEMKRNYDIRAIESGVYKPPIDVDIDKVKKIQRK